MGVVVVDASAMAAVAFGEPGQLAVERRLTGCTMHGPRLLHTELANIALKKVHRREAEASLILRRFAEARLVPIALTDPPVDQVVALALASGLSACDASYLWVAAALGAPLVTLDKELARAAKRIGVGAL